MYLILYGSCLPRPGPSGGDCHANPDRVRVQVHSAAANSRNTGKCPVYNGKKMDAVKITTFHQEYFCKKCGSPLGDPTSAEFLQDEIYLYYVCLKCLIYHCVYFTVANFVAFPKDEAHLTKRAPDRG